MQQVDSAEIRLESFLITVILKHNIKIGALSAKTSTISLFIAETSCFSSVEWQINCQLLKWPFRYLLTTVYSMPTPYGNCRGNRTFGLPLEDTIWTRCGRCLISMHVAVWFVESSLTDQATCAANTKQNTFMSTKSVIFALLRIIPQHFRDGLFNSGTVWSQINISIEKILVEMLIPQLHSFL